jgi:hypothetical protein
MCVSLSDLKNGQKMTESYLEVLQTNLTVTTGEVDELRRRG